MPQLPPHLEKLFYPASAPFSEGTLTVDGYTLPYKEYGNPDGIPIVSLHGGPGAGSRPDDYRVFDPEAFRIIIYDQRGAGASTPAGGLENNTPDNLADDMEVLRRHLGINQWHVYGGSWGSALSLLYAEKYPDKVKTLTLSGIFLLREYDDNLSLEASKIMRPEAFRKFKKFLLPDEQGDTEGDVSRMREAYYQKLFNPDPAVHYPAATATDAFLSAIDVAEPRKEETAAKNCSEQRLNGERICASFSRDHRFDPEDRLLRDINKIRHIPTKIVQGSRDMICPPKIADDLKAAFPEAELQTVDAGHSVPDPELLKALRQATDNIRDAGSPLAQKKTPPPSAASKTRPPAR